MELIQEGTIPDLYMWINSAAWAFGARRSASCSSSPGSVSLLSASTETGPPLAVRVDDLSITYRTTFERKPTLKQALVRFGRGQRAVKEVEASEREFRGVCRHRHGHHRRQRRREVDLMRAIAASCRRPPAASKWGKASTLLALGVGFNKKLSGRENILGGLAAGCRRTRWRSGPSRSRGSELGDFIDMPMHTYSSGMSARLGFSVAVHMKPDILMIDEALSTGDAHFREKANAKMAELRESSARAMFLVSHGLNSIKEMCAGNHLAGPRDADDAGRARGSRRRLHQVREGEEVRFDHRGHLAGFSQSKRHRRNSPRSPDSPSRPPLPTTIGGGDGLSLTPVSRSRIHRAR